MTGRAFAYIMESAWSIDVREYDRERLNALSQQGTLLWYRLGEVKLISWSLLANVLDILREYETLKDKELVAVIMERVFTITWDECIEIPELGKVNLATDPLPGGGTTNPNSGGVNPPTE
jgi:hypothetical protein